MILCEMNYFTASNDVTQLIIFNRTLQAAGNYNQTFSSTEAEREGRSSSVDKNIILFNSLKTPILNIREIVKDPVIKTGPKRVTTFNFNNVFFAVISTLFE